MPARAKRILVVAEDRALRESRSLLLQYSGYEVISVELDDEAMELLESGRFDLFLLGRDSGLPKKHLDQRVRERYPDLLTLKIDEMDPDRSPFPSRIIDGLPRHILAAISEMLAKPDA